MFGQGYTVQETAPQLPEGDYTAKIIDCKTGTLQDGRTGYVDIFFAIQDSTGRSFQGYKPDSKRIFDRPQNPSDISQAAAEHGKTLANEQMKWDRQMTAFFTAFGIQRGNFNTQSWVGSTGFISVRVDKANPSYMVIFFDAKRRQAWEAERMGQSQPNPQAYAQNVSQFPPAGVSIGTGSIPF